MIPSSARQTVAVAGLALLLLGPVLAGAALIGGMNADRQTAQSIRAAEADRLRALAANRELFETHASKVEAALAEAGLFTTETALQKRIGALVSDQGGTLLEIGVGQRQAIASAEWFEFQVRFSAPPTATAAILKQLEAGPPLLATEALRITRAPPRGLVLSNGGASELETELRLRAYAVAGAVGAGL